MKVLFVCLGNICRSPMAEGVFKHLLEKEGLTDKVFVDSAGTSRYHLGCLPDERMRGVARGKGITLDHKARQLSFGDFYDFHYIVAMDRSNFADIVSEKPVNDDHRAKIVLMRDFDPIPENKDVPDPYYGGSEGFINVYNILHRSCTEFLRHIKVEMILRDPVILK
jgi:protein-tyrosine phosphatase